MKVLHVIESLGAGGAERSLVEMLPSLTERGVQSTVVVLFRRAEGFEHELVATGADVRFLQARRFPARVLELRQCIRSVQPDIVHTSVFHADITGRLAAVRTHARVMTSLINMSYDASRRRDPRVKPWKLRLVQAIDGFTARHMTDHFHAISHAVKDDACQTFGLEPSRVTVIERGRVPQRLGGANEGRRADMRRALGLRPDDIIVVHVGRQEYQKNLGTLLQAVAVLAAARPNVVLVQAGRRGNVSDDLDATVRELGIGDNVRFLGHRDDVGDILACADIFAFPSLFEGLGGAVIEAMALSLPIVASRIPPLEEVLDDGGNAILVDREDAAGYARAIADLLDDGTKRKEFGRRSREIFEDRFTIERVIDRMVALYGAVARG